MLSRNLYENTYHKKNQFSFGKNWQDFLNQVFSEERVRKAEESLIFFLGGKEKIEGKTFIDVGCGSGLFSLAAYRLGAKEVVSIDVDEFSIECTNKLREKYKEEKKWEVKKGSALDKDFIGSLGKFDIVYSWGVLHHTGNMYQALENVSILMKEQGIFYLAIYNRSRSWWIGTSQFWLSVKKLYNKSGYLGKNIIFGLYFLYFLLDSIICLKNPFQRMKKFNRRGMNWYHNVLDWLGGLPYEFAAPYEITNFFAKKSIYSQKIENGYGLACVEYLLVFRPEPDHNK